MIKNFRISEFHKKAISKKTLFKVLTYIDSHKDLDTPILLIDKERLIENAKLIGSNIPNSKVFYAVKANSSKEILKTLAEENLGFEIASSGELELLKELNVPPEKIITSNPMKSPKFIQDLYKMGVKYFVFDSMCELEKLERFAPNSNCYVRICVPNEGSEWPLSKKFGCELEEAYNLIKLAKQRGMVKPVGITFHVGSQCLNPYNWYIAIDKARRLFDMCLQDGIQLSLLNIGGGYPISYTKLVPKIQEIDLKIKSYLKEKFGEYNLDIFLEPGRAIVGDCGIMVTRVIGLAKRGYENWLYLDVGVFNGLMEALGGIKYLYIPEKIDQNSIKQKHLPFFEKHKKWTIAGPSCDSMDVIEKNVYLEGDVISGQLVLIPSAGAYTTSYASEFNGFPIPNIKLI